ncbi:glutaminase [Psychrobacillus sp. NEAU-3TGS]|uniref:glutaminase n=1 Tax=Psychrobacillus sp. NEAU-3TGS TaxID=2995412 RepID=UPI002499336C|nr:glutaminase [Psychrobacillus sp. NEAU-3TGS]MDI2586542.1 glutaminase [Psychrobacillus sp. NEAU-3TGS]
MEQTSNQKLIDDWIKHYRSFTSQGKNASYIPALEKANSSHLGISIIEPDGSIIRSGDWEVVFTLQSISKVISFIAACMHHGVPYVLERVDLEPTGDPFDSIIRLEMHKLGKPLNPMINAGAITVSSILPGEDSKTKLDSVLLLMEKMVGKPFTYNEEVFLSEWKTANRNRALAYYLKETGYLEIEVEEALEVYLKQCSIEVTTEDIALMGLVLAHDGYHPLQKAQILPKEVARLAKSLMLTCGVYNNSGRFAAFIGIPSKTGVSGGVMAAVPPRVRQEASPLLEGCGIGIYGPAIDEYGSSVAGVFLLEKIAKTWDLSIF